MQRVHTHADAVQLDLADCFVDAIEITRATQDGIETLPPERLRTLSALFNGEFLDGLGSIATQLSTVGSRFSAADFVPVTPPCWSVSPQA